MMSKDKIKEIADNILVINISTDDNVEYYIDEKDAIKVAQQIHALYKDMVSLDTEVEVGCGCAYAFKCGCEAGKIKTTIRQLMGER